MFALVQFLVDKIKEVVPVSSIKNFKNEKIPSEADTSSVFEVFWNSPSGEGSGYYYAVVLLVAETQEFIEQRKKRVKFPSTKKLDELLASKLNEKNENEEERRRKSKEVLEKRKYCEKEQLREILNKRLNCKRRVGDSDDDIRASTSKRVSSFPHTESSDDELVLKSEINSVRGEYRKILKKYKIQQEENKKLKGKCEKLQELNIKLQTQLLSFLNKSGTPECSLPEIVGTTLNNLPKDQNVKSCLWEKNLPQTSVAAEASSFLTAPMKAVEVNAGGCLWEKNLPQTSVATEASGFLTAPMKAVEVNAGVIQHNHEILSESNEIMLDRSKTDEEDSPIQLPTQGLYLHKKLLKWEDGKMELAPGIEVTNDQWEKITRGKNVNTSKFTRNLAVSLWGSDTLKRRSVTGRPCRRFKKFGVEAKEGLTPIKIDAVQNGLCFFLKSQGKEDEEIMTLSSSVAVKRMLSHKIMDLNKQEKKISKFEI